MFVTDTKSTVIFYTKYNYLISDLQFWNIEITDSICFFLEKFVEKDW